MQQIAAFGHVRFCFFKFGHKKCPKMKTGKKSLKKKFVKNDNFFKYQF